MKHHDTPLTNHMGLPALVSLKAHRPLHQERPPRRSLPGLEGEAQGDAREAQVAVSWADSGFAGAGAGRRPPHGGLGDDRHQLLLIIGLFDLTCYYYNFIVLWAATGTCGTRYLVVLMMMAVTARSSSCSTAGTTLQYQWESLLVPIATLHRGRLRVAQPQDVWISSRGCTRRLLSGPRLRRKLLRLLALALALATPASAQRRPFDRPSPPAGPCRRPGPPRSQPRGARVVLQTIEAPRGPGGVVRWARPRLRLRLPPDGRQAGPRVVPGGGPARLAGLPRAGRARRRPVRLGRPAGLVDVRSERPRRRASGR
ncbi:MAG: hypothetical protein R3F43_26295 [bacterium]